MKLSKRAIEDFKKMYSADYGLVLNDADANSLGCELLKLVALISSEEKNE